MQVPLLPFSTQTPSPKLSVPPPPGVLHGGGEKLLLHRIPCLTGRGRWGWEVGFLSYLGLCSGGVERPKITDCNPGEKGTIFPPFWKPGALGNGAGW